MMNIRFYRTLALLAMLTMGSCIKDEHLKPCPPLKVNIEVKDKNYFNVLYVESEAKVDENLPFRCYVPTLYYRLQLLHNDGTTSVIEEYPLSEVEGDNRTVEVTFPDSYPHGTYIMSTWGGLKDLSLLNGDRTATTLHASHAAGEDIYFTQDTLIYDAYRHDYTVALERTKGKLVIEGKNIPASIRFSDMEVRNVAHQMDCGFHYSGLTSVLRQYTWDSITDVVTSSISAPSLSKNGTHVKVRLFDTPEMEIPTFTPPVTPLTISRNRITALRYVYESPERFKVYILINDNWELVHDMIIE